MTDKYRIFGSELSPYSVKVRSYFRYKDLPHEWVVRNQDNMAEFQEYAKLPLIPLVITPEKDGLQDSTPLIEAMEARAPGPAIQPDDPVLAFISALIEEYADEWGNKHMFHYRWAYEADQWSAAERIVGDNMPDASKEEREAFVTAIRDRMINRRHFVGSSDETKDQIEGSFRRLLEILEAHLAARPFLLGRRPAFCDFGLYAQVYEAWTDPTPKKIVEQEAPTVLAWIKRMLDPEPENGFEDWETLAPTLMPLLKEEIGALFLPWTTANAMALAEGDERFSVEIAGRTFSQQPQKYHARSLKALKEKYAAVPAEERARLDAILEEAGCLSWLKAKV